MSTKKIIELITQLDDKGLKELDQGLKKVKKNNEEVDKSAKRQVNP